jgi:hypothetical protein
VRALAANRKALAVAEAAIAGQVHQPLDVHRGLATKIAFHRVASVNRFAQMENVLIRKILNPGRRRNAKLGGDFAGLGRTNAVNISQRNFNALVGGDIDPRDTCHLYFSCSTEWLAHHSISTLRDIPDDKNDARKNTPPHRIDQEWLAD